MIRWIKYLPKLFLNLILDSIQFTLFFIKLIRYNGFRKSIAKERIPIVAVLANGPSLQNVLPGLIKDVELKDLYYVAMNFFAFEDYIFQLKPKYYCLVDSMFFQESHRQDDVKKLYDILENQITWNMNICIPADRHKDFLEFSKLKNVNLKIIKMNIIEYRGFEKWRNYFYRRNLAMPNPYNVSIMAIYVALNIGYSEVRLYGVDHSFFDLLCVNENNQLCSREAHFYDHGEAYLKPIIRNDNGEQWKVSDFLASSSLMFKCHELLANYATYLNVKVVNYTKESMIDSYERHKYE